MRFPPSPLLLLLGGCVIDNGIDSRKDVDATEEVPQILVEPDALYFDTLDLGASSAQSFKVSNVGGADLHISSLQLYGTSAFTLNTPEPSPVLAPGESLTFDVTFSPVGPEDRANIHILNNDAGSPEPLVYLEGTGRVAELLITPDPLDFGNVLIGCSRAETVYLQNIGEATLTVSSLAAIGDGFVLEDAPAVPFSIQPGEHVEASLRLQPAAAEYYAGEIWVNANTIVNPTVAVQTGAGTVDGAVREEFWQGDGPWERGDILFYVDQSGSMRDNKATLAANFEAFASRLSSLDLDWQVGVAIKDNGCFAKGILTPDTPSLIETFTDAVDGWAGEYTEAGLTITRNALGEAGNGGCNEGFLREDSKVTLVMVSDEVEQSPDGSAYVTTQIQNLAPTGTITSIVGPYPTGCLPGADPGEGYYEASLATGGAFLSICADDWSPYFETIATMTASGQLNSFHLTSEPDSATISVLVDDIPLTTGWSYDAESNSIVFEEAAIPEPGAHIIVDFMLAGDCES